MNQIKQSIEELKIIQLKPKLHLATYFIDLKAQVDSKLTFKKTKKKQTILKL